LKISYKKLWKLLVEKEISAATIRKDLNIATGTMTKLRRNESVSIHTAAAAVHLRILPKFFIILLPFILYCFLNIVLRT